MLMNPCVYCGHFLGSCGPARDETGVSACCPDCSGRTSHIAPAVLDHVRDQERRRITTELAAIGDLTTATQRVAAWYDAVIADRQPPDLDPTDIALVLDALPDWLTAPHQEN